MPMGLMSTIAAVVVNRFQGGIFIARKSEVITTLAAVTGSTAAAATPTVCRYGVYTVAPDGTMTLVASTPNDTTMFSVANTAYPRALSTPFNKQAGVAYCFGMAIVSAAGAPTMHGYQEPNGVNAIQAFLPIPYWGIQLSGIVDLPASGSIGTISGTVPFLYGIP